MGSFLSSPLESAEYTSFHIDQNYTTAHFGNGELEQLAQCYYRCSGMICDVPSVGVIAEKIHRFASDCEMYADPMVEQMWKDGLGVFLSTAWRMVARKKGIRIASAD